VRIRESEDTIIYLRVSTEEQARDAYGLESQEKSCVQLCADRGWAVKEVFTDAGVSGWADVDRPAFRRMMETIRVNPDVNLVFFDYSRFGRKVLPALKAFEKLDNLGVLSIAANNPGIDCRTAAGRTARRDELSRAEDFSDQHSEKTAARMRSAFEEGRWCRPAPLGYRTVAVRQKGSSNLVRDENEAKLVSEAFEAVALGHETPIAVLRRLTEKGLRSKRPA
jgi:site-specific DNA recombinase